MSHEELRLCASGCRGGQEHCCVVRWPRGDLLQRWCHGCPRYVHQGWLRNAVQANHLSHLLLVDLLLPSLEAAAPTRGMGEPVVVTCVIELLTGRLWAYLPTLPTQLRNAGIRKCFCFYGQFEMFFQHWSSCQSTSDSRYRVGFIRTISIVHSHTCRAQQRDWLEQ